MNENRTSEQTAAANDTAGTRLVPPLGGFQEVDGRRLFVHRSGSGGPAVVFLPGASAIGLDYYGLQQQVAEFTTAVVYDRGGSGYSDPMPLPRTAEAVATELLELLRAEGIPGPYVLVAHSLGGAYAYRFAQLHPQETAGLVWLDAFHRNWDDHMPAEGGLAAGEAIAPTREQLEQAVPFLRDMIAGMYADFPEDVREAVLDYHVSDTWIDVGMAERGTLVAVAEELLAGPGLPDVPVVAFTPLGVDPSQQALMSEEALQAIHDGKTRLDAELVASVTDGEQRLLEDTNHSQLITDRADDVVQGIRDVCDGAVRDNTDNTDNTTDTKEHAVTVTLTDQDKTTIRTAAYGAVTLLSFAGIAGSAHKVATDGSLALAAATGTVGHVLAEKTRDLKLKGKSAAAVADYVLPALTDSVRLLRAQDPAEAENFRTAVTVAVAAANRAHKGEPSPTMAEMTRKIDEALDAA